MTDASFQTKLKAIQKHYDKIAPLIEGLEQDIPQQSLKDYFIKLQILVKEDQEKYYGNYESISGEKKEVELEDIFTNLADNQKPINKLLILGGAGVGKSTLMQYIAYKWGSGELWNNKYDLVYRVSLKTLLNNGWKHYYTPEALSGDILKCLVHRNLVMKLDDDSIKEPTINEIDWPEDKNRVLLLCDGYDEIAHLKTNTRVAGDDYRKLEKQIFKHQHLIFTSRPNAVDKTIKDQFDRTVENVGLDNTGIDHYFNIYFSGEKKSKGEELYKFLAENPAIKELCKIPVNIAMLSYIWSVAESDEQLKKISSISGLYKSMLNHLGKRYVAKEWNDDQTSQESVLNNGRFILNEFKVLSHVGYMGITGGGVLPASQGQETLIIKGAADNEGMLDLEDEQNISIQSSINYLAANDLIPNDQRSKVTVQAVYKYGLLKPEGAVGALKTNKDLHKQSFSFLHLTFQEYLTAYYFKEQLTSPKVNENEKRNICQYIAEHRNQPRYLMVLKFLAGIITDDQRPAANQAAAMFWDAILCNADGIVELGIDTKVTLMMHLFSQAKVKEALDARIPNKETAVALIDAVVLNDLFSWRSQLKESDYMTDNIRQGVVEAFTQDSLEWHASKVQEISEACTKFSLPLQAAIKNLVSKKTSETSVKGESKPGLITGLAIGMATTLSEKLTSEDQKTLLRRTKEIIQQSQQQEFILNTRIIPKLGQLLQRIPFNQGDLKELLTKLVGLLDVSNLRSLVPTVIGDMVKLTQDQQFINEVLEQSRNIKIPENSWSTTREQSDELKQRCKATAEITGAIRNKELALQIITYFVELYKNDKVPQNLSIAALNRILELFKDKELIKKTFALLIPQFLVFTGYSVSQFNELNLFREEVKAEGAEQIIPFLKNEYPDQQQKFNIFAAASRLLANTLKGYEQCIVLLNDQSIEIRSVALDSLGSILLKVQDKKLAKAAFQKVAPFLFIKDLFSSLAIRPTDAIINIAKVATSTQKIMPCYQSLRDFCLQGIEGLTPELVIRPIEASNEDDAIDRVVQLITSFLSSPDAKHRHFALSLCNGELLNACKDQTLRRNIVTQATNLLYDNDQKTVESVLKALADQIDEKVPIDELLGKVPALINQNNSRLIGVRAVNIMEKLIKLCKDKYLRKRSILQLVNLLNDESNKENRGLGVVYKMTNPAYSYEDDKTLLERTIEALTRFVDMIIDEEMVDEVLEKIASFEMSSVSLNHRKEALKIIAQLTQSTRNRESAIKLFEGAVSHLIETQNFSKDNTMHIIGIQDIWNTMIKLIKDSEIAALVLKKVFPSYVNTFSGYWVDFGPLFTLTNDESFIAQFYEALMDNIDPNEAIFPINPVKTRAFYTIWKLVSAKQDKGLAQRAIERITVLDNKNSNKVSVTYWQATGKLFETIGDTKATFNFYNSVIEQILKAEIATDPTKIEDALAEINSLLTQVSNKELTAKTIERAEALSLFTCKDPYTRIIVGKDFASYIMQFLLNSEKLPKYLQIPSENLQSQLILKIVGSFRTLITRMSQLEELLKDPQNFNIEAINAQLFGNQMSQEFQEELKTCLDSFKEDDDNNLRSGKLKKVLVPKINQTESAKGYELIRVAVAVIGHDEAESQDEKNKELLELAQKIINLQLDHMDEDGLEWINSNFEALAGLSKESKPFSKKLYAKLVEDSVITSLEEKLIIKSINQGLTTSISRDGEIIFEGKRYKIISENTVQLLETITKSIIRQEQDLLALQYKDHQPIFPKSSEYGMKKAAADIEQVYSAVEKSQVLPADELFFAKLIKSESSVPPLFLLEQRSTIGDHLIYWSNSLNETKFKFMRINPVDNNLKMLEQIFGKYIPKLRYQGVVVSLPLEQGIEITNGTIKDIDSLFQGKDLSQYFQQELLCSGNTDRMNYLTEELGNKLTDYQKSLTSKLKNKVPKDVQDKVIEYYRAFVGTFASVYTAAQVIDSGQIVLDNGGNTKANMLATIASFAPFVGEKLSSYITSAGQFIQTRDMLNNARKMKRLASDGTALSQLVGETAEKIIFNKTKQQDIITMTEQQFRQIPNNIIEKITQFIGDIQENIDQYLYLKTYNTPAAMLGNNDANMLIEAWVNDQITSANTTVIVNSFFALATGENVPVNQNNIQVEEKTIASGCFTANPNDIQLEEAPTRTITCCALF